MHEPVGGSPGWSGRVLPPAGRTANRREAQVAATCEAKDVTWVRGRAEKNEPGNRRLVKNVKVFVVK